MTTLQCRRRFARISYFEATKTSHTTGIQIWEMVTVISKFNTLSSFYYFCGNGIWSLNSRISETWMKDTYKSNACWSLLFHYSPWIASNRRRLRPWQRRYVWGRRYYPSSRLSSCHTSPSFSSSPRPSWRTLPLVWSFHLARRTSWAGPRIL